MLLTAVLMITALAGNGIYTGSVQAAGTADTADLRLLFTSDLHGQLTTVDYETGGAYNEGSLAKVATLIQNARNEKGINNTMLFDGGDNMYDYTTDYIYNYDEKAVQPHFSALASLGYDAITLGNHDFEYTLPYIQYQYDSTGLTDKVVLSNVKDANTGASIWNETKMFEKVLTTKQGHQMSVKVGVIGETIPTLSKKRQNYTGVLTTEDIVENATREADALKAAGADLIVVVAHSGIGEENPEKMATDAGYALTKIPNVDVVLCGHRHAFFCADGKTQYDKMSGVDPATGLVNGKNLVMVKNRGAGIAVVDLTLSNESGNVQICERKSSLRKVTVDVQADPNINNNYFGDWAGIFMSDRSAILSELASSARLQNYFGTIEDSGAIQLMNDIKISYGLDYINNVDTNYQNYPVVAVSKYLKYGAEDGADYIDISGQFTRANMYDLIDYRTSLYVFTITGAQIREWLEWSASAYEQPGGNVLASPAPPAADTAPPATSAAVASTDTPEPAVSPSQGGITDGQGEESEPASTVQNRIFRQTAAILKGTAGDYQDVLDGIIKNYKGEQSLQSVLREEWISDWSNFYIFDGVEYTIDTSVAPRYDQDGNKINDSRRITSLTRNGVPVSDGERFILVGNKISSIPLLSQIEKQELYHGNTDICRNYVVNYINKLSLTGTMKNTQDNNWRVNYNTGYQYLVRTGERSQELTDSRKWIKGLLSTENRFHYYQADFSQMSSSDQTGPNVVALALKDVETNKNVKVAVQATDVSGVVSVKYLKGKYLMNSAVWDFALNMTDNYFECDENSIYSILAEDLFGNKTLTYVRINNINKSALEAPKVDSYTNRKQYITGTAEPNANIYFELQNGNVYSDTVKEDGTFKYALVPQKSGAKVYVYVTDDEGRASSRTVVTVKRTGPNKPVLSEVETRSRQVSGSLNDTYVYPVVIVNDKTAYMANDGTKAIYENSELYDAKYKVVEVEMNMTDSGSFSFEMESLQKKGIKIDLRTLDAIGRKSMLTRQKVKQTVPAKPSADQVTNQAKKVKIYSEEKCDSASVKIGKKVYTVKKSKYISKEQAYRYSVTIPRTDSGVSLKYYVTNVKGDSPKVSMTKTEVVPNTPKLNSVKAKKKVITGSVHLVGSDDEVKTVANTKTKVYVYVNKKKYTAKIKANGTFRVKVKKKLASGDKITCQAKNLKGKSLKRVKKVK